jgi:hypothetical protein
VIMVMNYCFVVDQVTTVSSWYLYIGEGKGKRYSCPRAFFLTEHHAMKEYWGSGSIASHIF